MESIGRYKVLGEIGRGGCGVVYRALDPGIGRVIAVKTILIDGQDAQAMRERFRREARSAGILSHPNIVTIHDFSDDGEMMFIAMEYVEGKTLSEYMREGLVSVDFALSALYEAADALDYAHSHQIVHRDVKPANFLITRDGHVKMADFGIAKMLDSDVPLTSTGMVIGTAQYMSPEQIASQEVTARSDQFSLAVIAYEMLTGQKPFQGNSWASMMHAIVTSEPPPLKQYRKDLGDSVTKVLRKALAKVPAHRYSTCREFVEALDRSIFGTKGLSAMRERSGSWQTTRKVPVEIHETVEMPITGTPAVTGPRIGPPTLPGAPPEPASKRNLLLAGAGVAVLAAAGAFLGFRAGQHPAPAPTPTPAAPVAAAAPVSGTEPNTPIAPPPPPSPSKAAPKEEPKQTAKAEPAPTTRPSSPARVEPAPAVITPAPPQARKEDPAPKQAADEQARKQAEDQARKQAADEQARKQAEDQARKQAADEQARKQADDQARKQAADEQARKQAADEQARKQAAAEQARKQAEDQARAAKAAELQSVNRALRDYEAAYTRRDSSALQAIWPSIPKQVLEGVRASFHDASEVEMTVTPAGDPEISGNTASLTCDRRVRQVIQKKPLEASSRVRIVLARRGSGWIIQSVDSISK